MINSEVIWLSVLESVWGPGIVEFATTAMARCPELKFLGSAYGGWVVDTRIMDAGVLISAGVGEDASFEIEVLNQFSPDVLSVDPTPRARAHLELIAARWGEPRTSAYRGGGERQVDEYDLTRLVADRFFFCEAALAGERGEIDLFYPKNKAHVSLSCIQSVYASDTLLTASAFTVADLDGVFKDQKIGTLKLDVEGAEIEILSRMLIDEIYPMQLCVEFDALRFSPKLSQQPVITILRQLKIFGYELKWCDRSLNCLLVKNVEDK